MGKTPRTEPGKNDLHYCQRTTASGDGRLRPAGAEWSWFGNTIFGWAVRVYVSKRKTRTKSITASLGNWMTIENKQSGGLWCSFLAIENTTVFQSNVRVLSSGAHLGHRESFRSWNSTSEKTGTSSQSEIGGRPTDRSN